MTCFVLDGNLRLQANQASRVLLREMHQEFLRLCQAVQQAGLRAPGVDVEKWSKEVAQHDCGFLARFPKSNKEQAKVKEELLHAWGRRVRELCPHMWRAANAVLRAELAPFVEMGQLPDWLQARSQRPLCGQTRAASLSAAIGMASSVARVASMHVLHAGLAVGMQELRTLEAKLVAQADGGNELESAREALAALKEGMEEAGTRVAQAEAELPAAIRGGGEAAEEAPGMLMGC